MSNSVSKVVWAPISNRWGDTHYPCNVRLVFTGQTITKVHKRLSKGGFKETQVEVKEVTHRDFGKYSKAAKCPAKLSLVVC